MFGEEIHLRMVLTVRILYGSVLRIVEYTMVHMRHQVSGDL